MSGMEKELRGIIHKCLNEKMKELDIKKWIETRIDRMIEASIDRLIEKKVYAFLEEAEIEVPTGYRYGKRITINEHIIQVITHVATNRARNLLKGLVVKLDDEN